MFDAVLITSVVGSVVQGIKEAFEPVIPAKNWGNREAYNKDLMDGVPAKQRMKNLQNGKYRLENNHPEPHRDPVDGRIIIENCKLYDEDVQNYDAYQVQQWVKQGRYNLSQEELRKERKRIEDEYKYLCSLV
jgi:hypothetical protein